jgi:hypothetical protein
MVLGIGEAIAIGALAAVVTRSIVARFPHAFREPTPRRGLGSLPAFLEREMTSTKKRERIVIGCIYPARFAVKYYQQKCTLLATYRTPPVSKQHPNRSAAKRADFYQSVLDAVPQRERGEAWNELDALTKSLDRLAGR